MPASVAMSDTLELKNPFRAKTCVAARRIASRLSGAVDLAELVVREPLDIFIDFAEEVMNEYSFILWQDAGRPGRKSSGFAQDYVYGATAAGVKTGRDTATNRERVPYASPVAA